MDTYAYHLCFSREGNDNPLQYSCLENPMDRGAWRATVHGMAKSQTGLSDYHFHLVVANKKHLLSHGFCEKVSNLRVA